MTEKNNDEEDTSMTVVRELELLSAAVDHASNLDTIITVASQEDADAHDRIMNYLAARFGFLKA